MLVDAVANSQAIATGRQRSRAETETTDSKLCNGVPLMLNLVYKKKKTIYIYIYIYIYISKAQQSCDPATALGTLPLYMYIAEWKDDFAIGS